jgi:RNA polymerase sigma-70 factor (ECF subfamily)
MTPARTARSVARRVVVPGDLLAADAVVVGDGGGKAPRWPVPIVGAERAAAVLASVGRRVGELAGRLEVREVNGQPGALVQAADGRLINVFALDIADGRVQAIRSVINPDKLGHVGPTADVWALLHHAARREDPDSHALRG